MSDERLAELRKRIAETDESLIELIARRMRLAHEVGEHKKAKAMPVKDYGVERQVIEKARAKAKSLNVYAELVEDVMRSLIRYSVMHQQVIGRGAEAQGTSTAQRVTVVGGAGQMGQWLAQFCDSMGHQVRLHDVVAPRAPGIAYPYTARLDEAVADADVIFLATPLSRTAEAIDAVAALRPAGIVVEIASLKSPVADALLRAARGGLKVNSIHPMFGPNAEVLLGKNLLILDHADFHPADAVEALFRRTSLTVAHVAFEDHDRLMSYVLGSAHLLNLLNAQLLATSGLPLAAIERSAGTTFAQQLAITRGVSQENQDLYFEIQSLNRETPALMASLRQALADFEACLQAGDRATFRALMENGKNYLISSPKTGD